MNGARSSTGESSELRARRYARDLLWAIESPSLADSALPAVADPRWPEGVAIDADKLASWLESRPTHRVGRYFEDLVAFYLTEIRGARIVAHGLQVTRDGRTAGEIDLLFDDPSGERVHWEVAVKFYLLAPEPNEAGSLLLGPNASDSWECKAEILFGRQLGLGRAIDSRVTRSEALVRGRIHLRPKAFTPAVSRPEATRLSPSCATGIWITAGEAEAWAKTRTPDTRFEILGKPHWLTGSTASAGALDITAFRELVRRHFAVQARPVAFASWEPQRSGEVIHGFVVHDRWPAPADLPPRTA